MQEILTLQEVAKYLKIAEKTLYAYAQKGIVPGIRIGSAWRFRKDDIEKWLDVERKKTEASSKDVLKKLKSREKQ